MKHIGLTGGIGTGKSTVARVFEIIGIPVYHADIRAKDFLEKEEVILQLTTLFGKTILTPLHKVDRQALAAIVFGDKSKLDILNNLIHPLVETDFSDWCNLQKDVPYVMHEAAILFESGFNRLFDANILVTAPEELCISRVMVRNGITREMVLARTGKQWPQGQKQELADYIIVNDEESLILPQVLAIHQKIIKG
jgi:dephospho-CoA kinase